MNNEILISVLIPVYNGEKYLAQAIECILIQIYTNFELIIVDNCSSDTTEEIAKKYAANDKRIIYHRNDKHVNMAENWNRALLLAKGEYIKILCADDIIEPEYLEKFSEILYTHPNVSLVTSYEQFIGDRNDIRKMPNIPAIGELDGKIAQKSLFLYGNWIGSPSSVMFRRRDLYIGLFNQSFRHWMLDIDMWLRLLSIGNLYVLSKILTHNRIHDQRQSAIGNKLVFIREELIFQKFTFYFPEIYGSYTKEERKIISNRLISHLLREAYNGGKVSSILTSIKIGMDYDKILFLKFIVKKFIYKIFNNRITRKIKQLFKKKNFLTLNSLKWRKKFNYKKVYKEINIGSKKINTIGIVTIPVDILRARIFTPTGLKIKMIEETPHYLWIKNIIKNEDDLYSRNKYREYLKNFFPEEDEENQLSKIKTMALSFTPPFNISIYPLVLWGYGSYYAIICDGVHRAAIARALGYKFIECHLAKGAIRLKDFDHNIFDKII